MVSKLPFFPPLLSLSIRFQISNKNRCLLHSMIFFPLKCHVITPECVYSLGALQWRRYSLKFLHLFTYMLVNLNDECRYIPTYNNTRILSMAHTYTKGTLNFYVPKKNSSSLDWNQINNYYRYHAVHFSHFDFNIHVNLQFT